jgi:hypothetical protein
MSKQANIQFVADSINPHNEVAQKGLERLEKQMKVIICILFVFGSPLSAH